MLDSSVRNTRTPLTRKTGDFAARQGAALAWGVVALAAICLILVVVAATFIGTAGLSFGDVVTVFGHHLGFPVEPLADHQDAIIWQLRAPRAVGAAFIGAALATSGCVLQAITKNSLAEPYLLGTSSGASAGAIIVFILGFGAGRLTVSAGAFLGALLSLALLFLLLGRREYTSTRIVLIGVLIGQLFNAIGSLVLMTSGDAESVYGITHWLLGELSALRWDSTVLSLIISTVAILAFWLHSAQLDGLAFGAETAKSLGINVRRLQIGLLLITAALVGAIVAAVGAIGFVGLIVPHAMRFLVGSGHRTLIPASAFAGGIFLVVADTAARTLLAPQAVPVGVFTAIIGVPLFLVLLRRGTRA